MHGITFVRFLLIFVILVSRLAAFDGDLRHNRLPILFISDIQQPTWIETLWLQEHNNPTATQHIYRAIEQVSTAAAIFHLGDFTSIGMFGSYWKPVDDFQSKVPAPIYLVIGGGGGLLHSLLTGAEQRYRDVFNDTSSIRFFHYVQCDIGARSLEFSVRRLKHDFSEFASVDTVSVLYSKP